MIEAGPVYLARIEAVDQLRTAGVDSPEFDATELLSTLLAVPRGLLPMANDLTPRQAQQYADVVRRRTRREPLQHIIGTTGFYGLDIQVGPGVFIPRPETELLVQTALATIQSLKEPVVIDLCAGSAAIGIAIARTRPSASVFVVEAAPEANVWLRRNVEALAPSVRVIEGDALDETLPLPSAVDLVTCNPPYVPTSTPVDRETDEHDPRQAVFAGVDGLGLIAPLVPRIARLLRPGGVVLMEHDESHQAAVIELFEKSGHYESVRGLADLTGRPRFVQATRRPL